MEKIDLRNLTIDEMEAFILSLNEKKYRAKQLYEWINRHFVTDFGEMSNLPAALIAKLSEVSAIPTVNLRKKLTSEDNFTIKFLFSAPNSNIIQGDEIYFEGVLLRYDHGNTVCVSSQAGCRMGCVFCASGANGFIRNLTAGEMAAQVYAVSKDIGEPISNVVLMGSGEPFDNFDGTIKFTQIINSHDGLNVGRRHITVSTCGITDKIWAMFENDIQVTLAVSLHAPNDAIRGKLMPVSKKYPLDGLLKACKAYADKTRRRISFEYALIDGVNDDVKHAEELAGRLRNMLCHVNLIPLNGVTVGSRALPYKASGKETVERFVRTLNINNIGTTVRRRLGSDINAACGQLVSEYRTKVVEQCE
jgi:23S rRNA (adenine2503-C2)-methyltransferase